MAPIAPEILTSLRSIDPSATFTLSGSHRVTSSQNAVYFAKMCRTLNERDQFFGESESLKAMNDVAPGICPKVIRFDELEIPNSGGAVMISEYKDMGGLNSQVAQILAKRLALEMHDPERSKQATTKEDGTRQWGFHVPTYCGPTRIENGWYDTWEEAYGAMIGGLVDKLEGTSSEVVKLGRELQSK
ncbi:hypothetical protein FRC02_000490 [Tulasnella sp. 418]|nr:hypothetical protein FRC02_000490 [Tulasnella sp. 418]